MNTKTTRQAHLTLSRRFGSPECGPAGGEMTAGLFIYAGGKNESILIFKEYFL